MLEGHDNVAFAARYAEARGDAHVALEQYTEALAEYQAALGEPIPTIDPGLVQLTLLDLPRESVPTGEPESSDDAAVEPAEEAASEVAEEPAE